MPTLLVLALAAAAALPANLQRVRATDPRVVNAIADGVIRSPQFRTLISRVEQLDVIVYVEFEPELRGGSLLGRLKWVAATPEFRYVRVGISPDLSGHQLIATIGHELQHVAEIGEAPSVVSRETMSALYREVGEENRSRREQWETDAARRAGDIVRRELATPAALGVADATQARVRSERKLEVRK